MRGGSLMRRELTTTGLLALVLLASVPAYDRVFADTAWRAPTLAGAAIAVLLAAVVRRLGRGAVLSTVVSAVGAVALLPWLVGLADGPVVPGRAALEALGSLWAIGEVELAETPPPAPATAGLVLLTIVGWWLIAHLAHEVGVRLGREGAALVILTVLWAAPLAIEVPAGRGLAELVPFLVASALVMLAGADDEARRSGTVPRLSLVGVLVAAGGIVVAVSAPWLLPGHDQPAWVAFGASDAPRGYQPIVDVSNRLGSPEERDVLRVRSPQRTYLRLAGLDSFDGSTWRLGPPEGGTYSPEPDALHPATDLLPPEQPAASTQTFEVEVDVLELENIYVPLPYQPIEVLGPMRDDMVWSTDGGFLATWDTVEDDDAPTVGISEGTNYRVRVAEPNPDFEELEEVSFDPQTVSEHTQLPRDYPELGELAEEIYAEADADSVVERALALQDWFIGPEGDFTYDLEVPALRGEQALRDFVLEDRIGYCEYFATSMAVMLRETGIPARVAVGFLPGRVTDEAADDEELTEFTVSTGDAHAWVEVLFPGYGWITFEPTPRSDETQLLPRTDNLAPTENEAERTEELAEDQQQPGPGDIDQQVPDEQPESGAPVEGGDGTDDGSGSGGEGSPVTWSVVVAGAGLVVALLVVGVTRRRVTSTTGTHRERVIAAQRRLLATAARSGLGRRPHETIREVFDRWLHGGHIEQRHAATAPTVQAAAFDGPLDHASADAATTLLAEAEERLKHSVPRRRRLLAPLRSAGLVLRRAWARLSAHRARS
ncbi:MAG: transglutaminaseTgpA domain-containing protein [Nitriliruptoraceae bacterium]